VTADVVARLAPLTAALHLPPYDADDPYGYQVYLDAHVLLAVARLTPGRPHVGSPRERLIAAYAQFATGATVAQLRALLDVAPRTLQQAVALMLRQGALRRERGRLPGPGHRRQWLYFPPEGWQEGSADDGTL